MVNRSAPRLALLVCGLWGCGLADGARSALGEDPREHASTDGEMPQPVGFATLENGECVPIWPEDAERMEREAEARAKVEAVRNQRQCARGEGFACSFLADQLAEGKGVKKSERRARRFRESAAAAWTAACDGGDGNACMALGDAYAEGQGVAKDRRRGVQLHARGIGLFRTACDAGEGDACHDLGTEFILGRGVTTSRDEQQRLYRIGFRLERRSCENTKDWDACRNTALGLAGGEGVERDRAQADQFFEQAGALARAACKSGDSKACDYLEQSGRDEP